MSLNKKNKSNNFGRKLLILVCTLLMTVVTVASPLVYVLSKEDSEINNENQQEIHSEEDFSFAETAGN